MDDFNHSNSLWQNLQSTKFVQDRLLRVDIKCLQQNSIDNNIAVEWIESEQNLSDIMTKSGVNSENLRYVLKYGRLPKHIVYGNLQ